MEALRRCKDALTARGFAVTCFPTAKEASDYLNKAIDQTTVGFGGSMTLKEMGLFESLSSHNEVAFHWASGSLSAEEARKKASEAEVYLLSLNALAESGELVNIDGACNRVASSVYGHKRVYFVVGKNKLAPDLESAIHRARNVAAPKNARRLGRKTPCAINADRCYDCRSPERICRNLSVLYAPSMGVNMEIVLIDEELGY